MTMKSFHKPIPVTIRTSPPETVTIQNFADLYPKMHGADKQQYDAFLLAAWTGFTDDDIRDIMMKDESRRNVYLKFRYQDVEYFDEDIRQYVDRDKMITFINELPKAQMMREHVLELRSRYVQVAG